MRQQHKFNITGTAFIAVHVTVSEQYEKLLALNKHSLARNPPYLLFW